MVFSQEIGSIIEIVTTSSLRQPSQTTISLKKPISPQTNLHRNRAQSTYEIITSLSFDCSHTLVQVIYDQFKIRIKSGERFTHIELKDNSHITHLVAQFPADWKLTNKGGQQSQFQIQRTNTLAVSPAYSQSPPPSQSSLPRRASLPAPPNATQPLAQPAFSSRALGACPIPEAISQILPGLASQLSPPEPDTQEEEEVDGEGVDLSGLSAEQLEEVVAGVLHEEGFAELVDRVKSVLEM